MEGLQSCLDGLNKCVYSRGFGLPGEMDPEHFSFIGRAEPELVGCDGPNLGTLTTGAMACPNLRNASMAELACLRSSKYSLQLSKRARAIDLLRSVGICATPIALWCRCRSHMVIITW
jgi:hypothetical protein